MTYDATIMKAYRKRGKSDLRCIIIIMDSLGGFFLLNLDSALSRGTLQQLCE